jgi:hypothetical protein
VRGRLAVPLRLVALVLVLGGLVRSARGQAAPYLPLDHWAAPTVELLIRSGVIRDPDPLTRPLRVGDVLSALAAADTARASSAQRAAIQRLARALTPPAGDAWLYTEPFLGASSATDARRAPLREAGGDYLSGHGGGRIAARLGPVVLSSQPFFDNRLRTDPDYYGRKDKVMPHRVTDAYADLQWRYGEVFFGALDRNWGPAGIAGLLVSSEPYSYDHFLVRFGARRLRVEALVSVLDDMRNASGERVRRYWAVHRVAVQPWDWLSVTLNQATLWAGVGRGMELQYLNPFKLSTASQLDENNPSDSVNSIYAVDARATLSSGAALHLSVMVDDLGFTQGGLAPDRVAGTGAVDFPLHRWGGLRAYYTVVTSLAYRSSGGPIETIMRRNVGLGRNFSDYWEAGLQWDLMPAPLITVTPEVALLRQGEGDLRDPFPPFPYDVPTLFQGVIETTLRVGAETHATIAGALDVSANVGVHRVTNSGHVIGVSRTLGVAGIRATVRYGRYFRLD